MIRYLSFLSALVLTIALAGCGEQPEGVLLSSNETDAPDKGAGTQSACPLYFASEGLCAQISWTAGPSSDEKSSFTVKFWQKDSASPSGPFTEPKAEVSSFLRMTCCGSISFPKVSKVAEGTYSVTEVRFLPGNWEVYVQLKDGQAVDKQFTPVKIN